MKSAWSHDYEHVTDAGWTMLLLLLLQE